MKNDLHPFAVTAIAMFLVYPAVVNSCKCAEETAPATTSIKPEPPPASSGVVTTLPPTSVPYSPKEYTKDWLVVTEPDLRGLRGSWGTDDELGAWASIESRASAADAGTTWSIPFPWQLLFVSPGVDGSYDCGLFPDPEPGGWHLGYCMGGHLGKDRRASKIVLRYTKEPSEMLYIELDDVSFVVDRPPRSLRPE